MDYRADRSGQDREGVVADVASEGVEQRLVGGEESREVQARQSIERGGRRG